MNMGINGTLSFEEDLSNVVQNASEQGFQEYKQNSVFRFPVELRNGQEVVAEKTFEVDKENIAI